MSETIVQKQVAIGTPAAPGAHGQQQLYPQPQLQQQQVSMSQQQQQVVTPTGGDHMQIQLDMAIRLRQLLPEYEVKIAGQNLYQVQKGSLAMNILCGCAAQYYEFEVRICPQTVDVKSTVPCNGFWGGAIGMSKNKSETEEVTRILQMALANRQIYYVPASSTSPVTSSVAYSDMQQQAMHASGNHIKATPRPHEQSQQAPPQAGAAVAPHPMRMNNRSAPATAGASGAASGAGAPVKITTAIKPDGSKTVTKETTLQDGSRRIEVNTYPAQHGQE